MSNRRRRRRGPDVVRKIAEAVREDPEEVKAAIAAMVAEIGDFDEVYDVHLRAAINEGSVVDYAARLCAAEKGPSASSMKAADRLASSIQAHLDRERPARA